MSGRRVVRLTDRTRSPSPSFDRSSHRRLKADESSQSLPVSARLGGFVKNKASSNIANDIGKSRQSLEGHTRKRLQGSPDKYGPSPPPSYSSVVSKFTEGASAIDPDKQNFPSTFTVKRPIISGPDDSESDQIKTKNNNSEIRNRQLHRTSSGSHIVRTDNRTISLKGLDAGCIERNTSCASGDQFFDKDGVSHRNGTLTRRENPISSNRLGDGIRLERSIHGISIDTPLTCGLIDTHMHIDLSLGSLRQSAEVSWTDHCKRHSARFPACYEGAIAIFCQPANFKCSSPMLNEAFRTEKLWMTFGVHPHFADRYSEDSLRGCLHKFKTKVVALGEIGLDSSHKNHISLEVQKEVFRSQAEIGIECKLPLVIHTRLADGNAETLAFMRQFVPRDYLLHRHCFTGKWEEAMEWMSHFRNCYIGFTPLINTQPDLMEVARQVPLNRLLIETDAPYFKNGLPLLEDGGRATFTVPGDVIYTAAGLAKAKNLPIEAIICQTRLNAKKVYGI